MRPARNATFWVARSWRTVYPTVVGQANFHVVQWPLNLYPGDCLAAQGSGVEVLC
jgi:hypothetical protein